MRAELQAQLDRLLAFSRAAGHPLTLAPPVTSDVLERVMAQTGIPLDEDLRGLWQVCNGSPGQLWFLADTDEETPFSLMSVEEAQELYNVHGPYSADTDAIPDLEPDEYAGEWDARIQPGLLSHRHWFPFAEWGGWNAALYVDAAPTPQGKTGQIIVYQHDPDMMYYVADSFLSFFKASNDRLEQEGPRIFDSGWYFNPEP